MTIEVSSCQCLSGEEVRPEFKQWKCTVKMNIYIYPGHEFSQVCSGTYQPHQRVAGADTHTILSDFQDLISLLINI